MIDSAELRARLEAGIHELEGDIAKLKAAITALDGDIRAKAARKPRRRTPSVPKPEPEPVIVPAGKLLTLLTGSEGITTAELARQTGGAPDQILQMLKELEEAGTAHRSGARRTTRWHGGGQPGKPVRAKAAPRVAKPRKAKSVAASRTTVPEQDSEISQTESEAQIATALDSVVAS